MPGLMKKSKPGKWQDQLSCKFAQDLPIEGQMQSGMND
jgi:hypothetical protein